MKQLIPVLCVLLFLASFTNEKSNANSDAISRDYQELSPAQQLIDKSIAFHDPEGDWASFRSTMNFTVDLPDKPDMERTVSIDRLNDTFTFTAPYEEGVLVYEVNGNIGTAKWNDSVEIPEDISEKYRVSNDRAVMYRNYYIYLYGMPMKLKDPGTIVDPHVEQVIFHNGSYDRIRVTYEPEVGKDTWYFYFNKNNHALEAYQFFKDESKNDGEYILFEELVEKDGVKIPRIRKWYFNKDDKYLATDILKR